MTTEEKDIYVETRMGQMVSLLDPKPETIKLSDIAASLANINRFNGQCHTQHNVADHSIAVAIKAKQLGFCASSQLTALLHDAHEAYTGDITWPMKKLLDVYCPGVVAALQAKFDLVIWDALCPGLMFYAGPEIRQIDTDLVHAEAYKLMHPDGVGRSWKIPVAGVPPLAFSMRSPEAAEAKFITVFNRLLVEAKAEQADCQGDAVSEIAEDDDDPSMVPGRPELTGEADDEPGEYSEAE